MNVTRSRRIAGLFAIAVAVRLALLTSAAAPGRFMAEEDSVEYMQLARNLAAGHGFSQAAAPPYEPDVRRTPVYPSVLAALFVIPATGVRAAALAGVLISALTVLATFRLTSLIAGAAAAWWAALSLSLDLTSAAYATQVLTEPLFTLMLVLSFVPLLDRDSDASTGAVAAGALSGLAALCRPIAILAFAALAPACRLRGGRLSAAARLFVVTAAMAALLIGGWTLRNYRAAGTATVSSVAATNMYFHRAAYVDAYLRQVKVEDLRDEWARDFRARASSWSESDRVAWMNEHGRGLVLRHPFVYALVALRGAARMLTPDHIVLSSLVTPDAFRALRAVGWAQLALVYVLAMIGIARIGRASWLRLAVPLAPILYILLIGGPEMYPRFRVPLMPFICALAGAGVAFTDPARES
jgi:hypothetical protein